MITGDELFERLKDVKLGGSTCLFTLEKCHSLAPLVNRIEQLKREKNAVVLAHSYVGPEIIATVSDFSGDSYELSKWARTTSANTIVFVAVKFMAETAKLLNPDKTVLIPSRLNGCSLADSITGEDVSRLRRQFPEHTFVCYINTTVDVKAQCDVCVTSSNVYRIVDALPNDKIYFLPDRLMGQNLANYLKARGSTKTVDMWDGTCYVHEEYDPDLIRYLRLEHPGLKVASHPECHPSVVQESDFVGSTSQMLQYVAQTQAPEYFLLTECGLTSRLQLEFPNKKFVGSCTTCKYMKSNSLSDIVRVLEQPEDLDIVTLNSDDLAGAQACIDRMFDMVK
ncbi:quinolinate synthase NadA [bacterium]|nr:quinolinate synthase NadA [bacterium]